MWSVECGVWCVVCGVCGAWCVVRGAWCVVCGVWCVVRGVWCVVCGAFGVWGHVALRHVLFSGSAFACRTAFSMQTQSSHQAYGSQGNWFAPQSIAMS